MCLFKRAFVISEYIFIHFTIAGLKDLDIVRYIGSSLYRGLSYRDLLYWRHLISRRTAKSMDLNASLLIPTERNAYLYKLACLSIIITY